MTIHCPECAEPLPFSFGRQTCPQCLTVTVVRHDKAMEIEVIEARPRAIIKEDHLDLRMGVAGEDGEVRGACALCETLHLLFDLHPIQVGKLIRVRKEVWDRQLKQMKTIYLIMPLVRKALACDGCYPSYLTLVNHPKRRRDGTLVWGKDGELIYPTFITLKKRKVASHV